MRPRSQRLMEKRTGDGLVERLLRLAVGDHLNADEQTAPTHVADEAVFFLQCFRASSMTFPTRAEFSTSSVLKDRLDRAEPRRGGERVAAVARRHCRSARRRARADIALER